MMLSIPLATNINISLPSPLLSDKNIALNQNWGIQTDIFETNIINLA